MASPNPSGSRQPTPTSPAPHRKGIRQPPPPYWLMVALSLCLAAVVIALATKTFRPEQPGPAVAGAEGLRESPRPSAGPEKTETPASDPAAEPSPVPELSPVPEQSLAPELPLPSAQPEAPSESPADSGSWFSDAVFIGDSRVEGFRLYSGITSEATFLDHTGLTVYDVRDDKKVIRRGDRKISVLDALSADAYGKIYIALGINELGYFDPDGFAQTYGEVVEAIREKQPDARIYIQSLIPVNTAKCKANDIPYYITNEGVTGYNAALETYFADREDVFLLGIPEGLTDENGEMLGEYSADGVHLQKSGYVLWLKDLTGKTEGWSDQ